MSLIILGDGKHCVAMGNLQDGTPTLTIRKLPKAVEPGELLERETLPLDAYEVVIVVPTPATASVILTVAQSLAFAHDIKS